MKNILATLSSITLISSTTLTFSSTIDNSSKISSINNNNFNNKNINISSSLTNNDVQSGIFWYDPTVNVTSINDNPFGSSLLKDSEENYYDFVFLKSLKWDNNKKTINSSIDNIKSKDSLLRDLIDESRDISDYKKMETLKDQNGNLAIQQGMSLVNRYLNNGLLSFNDIGYIPQRTTYFSSTLRSKNNNKNNKQTVITCNYDNNIQTKSNLLDNINSYLSLNLHWYGIDITLNPKLIDNLLIDLINTGINEIEKVANETIDKLMDKLANYLKKQMFSASEKLMLTIDEDLVEEPELIAILDPIYTIIAFLISEKIGDEIKNCIDTIIQGAEDKIDNTMRKIMTNENNKIAHNLDPSAIGFKIEIHAHFLIFGSSFHLIPVFPPIISPSILIPAHPSLIFNNIDNILTGTTNNFTLIMNSTDWTEFIAWISDDIEFDNYIGGNAYLKLINFFNSNIILSNDDWKSILSQLGTLSMNDYHAACIHVIKENNEFKVTYTNLTPKDFENMPLPYTQPWLKASFVGTNKNNNLIISNSQFRSMLNAYDYTIDNWNDKKNSNGKVISKGIMNDSKQNPNKYTTYQEWFYHTYIICDVSNSNSDTSFWISNKINEKTIENLFNKYYKEFYLQQNNDNLTFSSLISNTTDNTNQILNISNENL